MNLSVIHAGFFKLDGGAMFGVVPKSMWKKLNPPDRNNMCTWALRCLLIETDDKKILVDTGMGDKQDEKFRSHFHPHGEENLLDSLKDKGISVEDITDVFLTHLHFDHVGGAVSKKEDGSLVPTFPHAKYWTNYQHYNWAIKPNPRERASFLKENFVPLQDAGVLNFIETFAGIEFLPNFKVHFVYGHTDAMMCPMITIRDKTVVFCADLLPSPGHIGLPYVMSYDVRPLTTIKEKEYILEQAEKNKWILFFEHAPKTEACTVKKNEKGRIVVDQKGTLAELLA